MRVTQQQTRDTKMKTIKHMELANFLRQNKSTFISMVTETTPKFTGGKKFEAETGRDPKKFTKVTEAVVLVGTAVDYGTLVENRVVRKVEDGSKDDVEVKERKWGVKVDGVEVTHTKDGEEKSYIIAHFVANNKPRVSYKYDGKDTELTDKEKEFLPKPKVSSTQADAGLTEATQIVHREYDSASIKAVTLGGETYIVV